MGRLSCAVPEDVLLVLHERAAEEGVGFAELVRRVLHAGLSGGVGEESESRQLLRAAARKGSVQATVALARFELEAEERARQALARAAAPPAPDSFDELAGRRQRS